MVNGAYIRVTLSINGDFMCFQKTPRGLYLGQCLVTFSLNLEVLYVAIMSIGAFGRLCWVSYMYCTLSKNLATQKIDTRWRVVHDTAL